MDYELAKQLEDLKCPVLIHKFPSGIAHCDLSQLIEACGEECRSIHRPRKYHWVATNNKIGENGNYEMKGTGSSPEEAVARLYISLHKNEKTL